MQEQESQLLLTDLDAEECASVNGGRRHRCRYYSYNYRYNNSNSGYYGHYYFRYPHRRSHRNISVTYY